MSYVVAAPELITSAATDLAGVGTTINSARAAAVTQTTGALAAAEDEVSAATAKLFGSYAQEFHTVLAQAAAFPEQFAASLASAGNAYLAAEAANTSAISGALGQLTLPVQSSLGGVSSAPAALSPMAVQPALQGTTIGLFMGGSGDPLPQLSPVALSYMNQRFSVLPANARALFTPENFYPFTGVKSLPLDVSVSQGVQLLDIAIKQQIAAGNSVAVFGGSQSAIISSLEMDNLANPLLNPTPPTANQLGFTLLGDQMNPNGGVLARFPGFAAGQPLRLPSLGITFYGATPSNTIYPTDIYTMEYDGWADFPQYPLNVISDLNAVAGILYVHGALASLDPSALPPGYTIQQLPTSPGYTGVTHYYMMTTPNGLPLLNPVRAIPVIGNPIADLLQPDLTTIVNLGYGNPDYGWSQGPADVQTYFGLFPDVSPQVIAQHLITGAQQGATAFVSDIRAEASGFALPGVSPSVASTTATGGGGLSLPALASAVAAAVSPDSLIGGIQGAITDVATGISGASANLYANALPTADILNDMVTVIPAYDADLFLSGIQQALDGNVVGGLQYALVAPLAADAGLLTLLGGFELMLVLAALYPA
ncbi:PE family protein [Mycobacterium sp. Marseille-P9652]|uniref:PE family protein n=1 Tax=Mycobacterium sp. Marseille-P9652 TaxID=2654950 RepID=UPI0012E87775|nr:PE-PPE domain-containing protein [Mycobacterium sp. Marseille-P9652]